MKSVTKVQQTYTQFQRLNPSNPTLKPSSTSVQAREKKLEYPNNTNLVLNLPSSKTLKVVVTAVKVIGLCDLLNSQALKNIMLTYSKSSLTIRRLTLT